MEARTKARSMKRSASMGRAASRSAARGKAKAIAMGIAKRGGVEDDIEMGLAPKRISPTYGTQSKGGKRRRSKKFYKGKASKSRKGRKDFVTHKGDKYFHRKGHRQTKIQGKSKGLFEQLFGL